MTLTESQYQNLVKFERHFLTAYKANYVTAIYKTTAEALTATYNEVFKTNKKATNCGKCVLDICKRLAPLYFNYKETLTATQDAEGTKETTTGENATHVEQEPTEEKKTPQKGKRGRKPKAKKTNAATAK